MSDVIVTVKTTYQTTEDTWERAVLTASFNSDEPINSILDWVYSKKGDMNTIKLHFDSRKDAQNG